MVYDDDESPTDFHDIPAESLRRREKERGGREPRVDPEIYEAIRKILKSYPSCGDATVEAILRRNKKITVSRSTIRTVMDELRGAERR